MLFWNKKRKKIGIFYICTGKYSLFWNGFFESCEKYFCPGYDIQYVVFTDQEIQPLTDKVTVVYQEKMGWPFDTLKRFHLFNTAKDLVADCDYLFFFNANMKFTHKVRGKDILPSASEGLVGVIHPYYYETPLNAPFEQNQNSLAYTSTQNARHYIQGCLNGGTKDAYLAMSETLAANIDRDMANDIIAVWHDESHLNAYFATHDSYKALSPGYAKPEGRQGFPFKERIIQLDKGKLGGHEFLRS